jgi:uncharacterized membrane protein YdbT with pleckstrin-like domain
MPNERVLQRTEPYLRDELIWLLIVGVPTLTVTFFIAATVWVRYRLMRFEWVLTDQRLILIGGWLTRRHTAISLDRVQEMNFRQDFWQRRFTHTVRLSIVTAATAGTSTLWRLYEDDPLRDMIENVVHHRVQEQEPPHDPSAFSRG